jgi:hypothetical protein
VSPHDGDVPFEDDPTGMRALLSSLPDPGPMPDDLVARIQASLLSESRSRAADAQTPHAIPQPPVATARHGASIPASRKRPLGQWIFGLAAAGLVVAGGGYAPCAGPLAGVTQRGGRLDGLRRGWKSTQPPRPSPRAMRAVRPRRLPTTPPSRGRSRSTEEDPPIRLRASRMRPIASCAEPRTPGRAVSPPTAPLGTATASRPASLHSASVQGTAR